MTTGSFRALDIDDGRPAGGQQPGGGALPRYGVRRARPAAFAAASAPAGGPIADDTAGDVLDNVRRLRRAGTGGDGAAEAAGGHADGTATGAESGATASGGSADATTSGASPAASHGDAPPSGAGPGAGDEGATTPAARTGRGRGTPSAGGNASAGAASAADGTGAGVGGGAGDDGIGTDGARDRPGAIRALQLVRDASIDRLRPSDESAREARNAMLRRAGTRVGSVAVAGVLIYAVFPVRTYLDQRAATRRAQEQIEVLGHENGRLAEQVERLSTDEEIERIARDQYGLVRPGEESYGVLPPPEPTVRPPTVPPAAPTTSTPPSSAPAD